MGAVAALQGAPAATLHPQSQPIPVDSEMDLSGVGESPALRGQEPSRKSDGSWPGSSRRYASFVASDTNDQVPPIEPEGGPRCQLVLRNPALEQLCSLAERLAVDRERERSFRLLASFGHPGHRSAKLELWTDLLEEGTDFLELLVAGRRISAEFYAQAKA